MRFWLRSWRPGSLGPQDETVAAPYRFTCSGLSPLRKRRKLEFRRKLLYKFRGRVLLVDSTVHLQQRCAMSAGGTGLKGENRSAQTGSRSGESYCHLVALLLMLPLLAALHGQAASVASVSGGVVDEQEAAIGGTQIRMTAVDRYGVQLGSLMRTDRMHGTGLCLTAPQWGRHCDQLCRASIGGSLKQNQLATEWSGATERGVAPMLDKSSKI
jgi:hypothetical protein